MERYPVKLIWAATANNPILSTELARRVVRIRLDPQCERPWTRDPASFRHPRLMEWCAENRGRLVAALLTLTQNWIVKGRPRPEKSLGSFESWGDVCGGILECAGVSGFLGNQDELFNSVDLEGQTWRAFVQTWFGARGSEPTTAGDLLAIALENDGIHLRGDTERAQRLALGYLLRKHKGRVIGEYRIELVESGNKGAVYSLTKVSADAPF